MNSSSQHRNPNSPRQSNEAEEPRNDAETNKDRREKARHLQKEAFQLANYYFLFQGVIFAAFYSVPSDTKCEHRWIPITLSTLAGVLNLAVLSKIAWDYKTTLDDVDKDVTRTRRGTSDDDDPIGVKGTRHWRTLYVVLCLALFIGFFVVTLRGCWVMTCSHIGNKQNYWKP